MLYFFRYHLELIPWVLLHRKQLLVVETYTHIWNARFKDFVVGEGGRLVLDDIVQKLNALLYVLAVVNLLYRLYFFVELVEKFSKVRHAFLVPFLSLQYLILFFYFEDEFIEVVELFLFDG